MTGKTGNGEDPAAGTSHEGRAVLVCAAADSEARARTCTELLSPGSAETIDLLCVSFSGPPAVDPAALRERGLSIDRTAFVLVGADADDVCADRTFAVESIETVDHLSDLGMYVRDLLSDWSVGKNPTAFCFDSVDDLVERAGFELAFEFLLILVEGNRRWDVTSHYHLDPGATDQQTRRTLAQLFDAVVEPDDDHA